MTVRILITAHVVSHYVVSRANGDTGMTQRFRAWW